jgi:hypothetical protein
VRNADQNRERFCSKYTLLDLNIMGNSYSVTFEHPLNGFPVDIQRSHGSLLISFRVIEHSPDVIGLHFCQSLPRLRLG